MGKSGDDEPEFSFAKLVGMDSYKKWAREMRYSLKSIGLWDYTLSDIENPKPVAIILLSKDLKNNTKLEHQKKRRDKIIAWTKNNVKWKSYIRCICLGHI